LGKGTRQELLRAIGNHEKHGKPVLLLYVCSDVKTATAAESIALTEVQEFVGEIQKENKVLFRRVEDGHAFERALRKDLSYYMQTCKSASKLRVSVSSDEPMLRSESASEQIGDISLTIWRPENWKSPTMSLDARVYLNTNVTDRIDPNGSVVDLKVLQTIGGTCRECRCDPRIVHGVTNAIDIKAIEIDTTSEVSTLRIIGIKAVMRKCSVTIGRFSPLPANSPAAHLFHAQKKMVISPLRRVYGPGWRAMWNGQKG
jgi:hypothetical protein